MEAPYQELFQSGHWLWNFNNVDLQQKVRHEHEGIHMIRHNILNIIRVIIFSDKHAHMLNIISRIAIKIRHLPNWKFDWSNTIPQRSHTSLTVIDFLMSEADAAEIHEMGSLQSLDWNGGLEWWNGMVEWNGEITNSAKNEVKGSQCFVDNFGIQVDAVTSSMVMSIC